MTSINVNGRNGITVGRRKDASRAILWDDNELQWFSAEEFKDMLVDDILRMLGV